MSDDKKHSTTHKTKWYHSMRVCKTIGVFCASTGVMLGGSSFLFREIKEEPALRTVTVIGGIISAGLGVFLLCKKYMNDPEALYEYYLWYLDHDLLDSIAEFGWDDLMKVVIADDILEKINLETEDALGFDILEKLYGTRNIGEMLNHNIYTRVDIQDKFAHDNKVMYGNTPAIARIDRYGVWLVQNAGIKPSEIVLLLLDCPITNSYDILTLNHYHLDVLCSHKLIDWGFIRTKVLEAMDQGRISFKYVKEDIGTWLVDTGVVAIEDLAPLFREVIINDDCSDILSNYWTWPLSKYGMRTGIESDELGKLESLNKKYQKAKSVYDTTVQKANQIYNSGKNAAEEKKRNQIKSIELDFNRVKNNETESESNRRQRKNALIEGAESDYNTKIEELKGTRDYNIHIADTTFETAKGDINHEWSEYMRGVNYRGNHNVNSAPINVVVNNSYSPPPQHSPPPSYYPPQQYQTYPQSNATAPYTQ
eukprot:TRINITY_DN583_c0_g1_i1.p1 TRINITY_DN583_c0_g1~~TRINITY_DN583_c0_g1_i1.p1  ORF type:complete len:480 (+),score=109.96 TRINITY_DN583_c0_g1_i1:56-1495(+)